MEEEAGDLDTEGPEAKAGCSGETSLGLVGTRGTDRGMLGGVHATEPPKVKEDGIKAPASATLPDSLKIRPGVFSVSWNTHSQNSSSSERWQWTKPPVTTQARPTFRQQGGMAARHSVAGGRKKPAAAGVMRWRSVHCVAVRDEKGAGLMPALDWLSLCPLSPMQVLSSWDGATHTQGDLSHISGHPPEIQPRMGASPNFPAILNLVD